MKKNKLARIAFFLVASFTAVSAINRDCLLDFHIAVAEAQIAQEQDLEYCNTQLIVVKCVLEAAASFQNSVYNAVEAYDDCVGAG